MVNIRDFTNSIDWDAWEEERDLIAGCRFEPGDEVKIGTHVFIVLDSFDGTGLIKIITKEILPSVGFGNNNNWNKSSLRQYLNGQFMQEIAGSIGEENIIGMTRDLISLDGLQDYGICTDNVSLLTAKEYAEYHELLGLKSNYRDWWWTITPWSTPRNGYSRYVCCVHFDGALGWCGCGGGCGVRPFLTVVASALQS